MTKSQPWVIAEISSNHRGSFEVAERLLIEIANAGADAVKFQTFTPESMTVKSTGANFTIDDANSPWRGRSLYGLYAEAQTPWAWLEDLFDVAKENGLEPFSTPFDFRAVDFLEELGVGRYKIASFENGDHELLRYVAQTGKPVILSLGMLSLKGIAESVECLEMAGCTDITLLKCTSVYPAPPEQLNLQTIVDLRERFGYPIGFSDHSVGVGAAIASAALGAEVIEKHVRQSGDTSSLDEKFSVTPEELRILVMESKIAAQARGTVSYALSPDEERSSQLRRSLFVVEDLKKGDVITKKNVRALRPSLGLPPRHLNEVLGQRVAKNVETGSPLTWSLISEGNGDGI